MAEKKKKIRFVADVRPGDDGLLARLCEACHLNPAVTKGVVIRAHVDTIPTIEVTADLYGEESLLAYPWVELLETATVVDDGTGE